MNVVAHNFGTQIIQFRLNISVKTATPIRMRVYHIRIRLVSRAVGIEGDYRLPFFCLEFYLLEKNNCPGSYPIDPPGLDLPGRFGPRWRRIRRIFQSDLPDPGLYWIQKLRIKSDKTKPPPPKIYNRYFIY